MVFCSGFFESGFEILKRKFSKPILSCPRNPNILECGLCVCNAFRLCTEP